MSLEDWNTLANLSRDIFPDDENNTSVFNQSDTVTPPPRTRKRGCVWNDSEDSDSDSEPRIDRQGSYYHLPVGTLARLKPGDHWVNHHVRAIGRIRDVTNPILYSFEEEGQHEIALDVRNADQNTKLCVESLLQVYGVVCIDKRSKTLRLCMDFAIVLSSDTNLKEFRETVVKQQQFVECEGCLRQRFSTAKQQKTAEDILDEKWKIRYSY